MLKGFSKTEFTTLVFRKKNGCLQLGSRSNNDVFIYTYVVGLELKLVLVNSWEKMFIELKHKKNEISGMFVLL